MILCERNALAYQFVEQNDCVYDSIVVANNMTQPYQ